MSVAEAGRFERPQGVGACNAGAVTVLRHHHPHVRRSRRTASPASLPAYYQEHVAIFGIDPVDLIAGGLPRRQQRLVEAWAELHQAELMTDWERLQRGLPPQPIEPLK